MLGLSLPTLHPSIPLVVQEEGRQDGLLMRMMRQRANDGLWIPSPLQLRRTEESPAAAIERAIEAHRHYPGEHILSIAVVDDPAHEDQPDIVFNVDIDIQPHGISIGRVVRALEKVQQGAGESLLAALHRLNDATMELYLLPQDVADRFVDYRYQDVDAAGPSMHFLRQDPVNGFEYIDAMAKACFEEMGYDDDDMPLPSRVHAELSAGTQGVEWLRPKIKVKLTADLFEKAGFQRQQAERIDLLLNTWVPEVARRWKRLQKAGARCCGEFYTFAYAVHLEDFTDPDATAKTPFVDALLDDMYQGLMQGETASHSLEIGVGDARRLGQPKGTRPLDSFKVVAAHLDAVRIAVELYNHIGD